MNPEVPQTGRQPISLTPEQIREALRRHHTLDQRDPFATDPNTEVRTLGRLALRRSDVNDLFALGDLCARLSLTEDGRLLVFYVGKALIAYRRAQEEAGTPFDRDRARRATSDYLNWLVIAARVYPMRRNVAVVLWAVGEEENILTEQTVTDLLDLYRGMNIRADDGTVAYGETGSSVFQSETVVTDFAALENTPISDDFEAISDTRIEQLPSSLVERQESLHESATHATIQPDSPRPGGVRADSDEFNVGDRIEGRYEVADVRRGGMGVVYLCYDHEQREPVALKSFQSRFLENERAVARFVQEALTWIRLEKHRYIVQARLVQNIGGRPYIILEHISGPEGLEPDLRSWIEHKRMTLPLSIEFGLHIALGMQHATRRVPGLVHRDLKPANILVTHDGIAKVTDFGLVRSLDVQETLVDIEFASEIDPSERLTRVGAILGTAPYISPEQCRSQDVDVRSDIYSFGCPLYEMLTGRHVFQVRKFEAWVHAHLNEQPTFSRLDEAALPPKLCDLVLKCLAKKPEDRPASWGEIADALTVLYQDVTGQPPVLEVAGPALEARELMDKGYSLTELGRYAEAVEAYDRAISLQPDYAWAWARKGRTQRLLERYPDALESYDEALRIQPRYAWAWKGRGMVLERLGRVPDALACYRTAADIDPVDVWNWYNQADALHNLGHEAEAIIALNKALEVDPAHPNSWAKLGQIYRIQSDFTQARYAYEQAIRLDPSYSWAHNGYGLVLKAMGDYKEALLSFKRAARYQPDEVWHWYNVTEMLVELRQYEEALQPAQQATRVDALHAFSWAKMGQVLRYLRRHEEALDAYNRAIQIQPDYAWAINGKGIVLEQLERYEEALEAYRSAAVAGGVDVWHWYNQGNVLALLNRYDEALPALQNAVEANPNHARSWARIGNVLRQLGRYDEALKAYERATTLEPNYAWAWNEQGIALEALKQYDRALEAYRRAEQAAPDDALYVYGQADVLISLNEFEQALDLLERSLKLDNRNARTWAKMGQVLRWLERPAEALRAYTRAVELEPNYAWAWNGRGLALASFDRHEEALDCFRRAMELDPNDVWYWYNQGDALVALGHFRAASEVLEHATRLDPAHRKLGEARSSLPPHRPSRRGAGRLRSRAGA
ncbi:MAG: tetratricopeptide repeat protein [Anaerolineae bacterium]